MLVFGVQQSVSVIYIYIYDIYFYSVIYIICNNIHYYIFFFTFFSIMVYGLLQNFEYSSLCYTRTLLFILYIVVCIC